MPILVNHSLYSNQGFCKGPNPPFTLKPENIIFHKSQNYVTHRAKVSEIGNVYWRKQIIWYMNLRIFHTKIIIVKEKKFQTKLKQVSAFSELRTHKYFLWASNNSSFRKQSTFLYSYTLYVCIQVVRHVYGTQRHIFQEQIEHQFRLLLTNDCYINFCYTSYSLCP